MKAHGRTSDRKCYCSWLKLRTRWMLFLAKFMGDPVESNVMATFPSDVSVGGCSRMFCAPFGSGRRHTVENPMKSFPQIWVKIKNV